MWCNWGNIEAPELDQWRERHLREFVVCRVQGSLEGVVQGSAKRIDEVANNKSVQPIGSRSFQVLASRIREPKKFHTLMGQSNS